MPANLVNSAVATGLEKVSFHSSPKERQCQRMFKLLHNCTHLASKLMLKILQARFQQYVNWEHPDVQAGFRKSRVTRDQIANICWIIKNAREIQKNIYFCFIDYARAFVWITRNWKILKETGKTRRPYLPPEKSVAGQETTEPDMDQWTGSKLGKEYIKDVYCHPAYLTCMQSTSCEMLGWWNTSWNQICWEKYQ